MANLKIISFASETGVGNPRELLVTKEEALKIIENSDNVDIDIYCGPAIHDMADADDFDNIVEQAVRSIYSEERISIPAFQSKFRIGYNRASQIMNLLENIGILSIAEKAGSVSERDVLVTEDQALLILHKYKDK